MSNPTTNIQSSDTPNNGRRTRAERGLPTDDNLRELARLYLETQRRLWPELGQVQPYAKATDEDIREMVEAFKEQFLATRPNGHKVLRSHLGSQGVGVSYLRYSCDNSNPRSLDDQLRLQLEKAQKRGEFIPWEYVFADASVTGTHRDRTGYKLAKKAVRKDDKVTTLYIDEVGRASRDGVEALRLGKLMQDLGKCILGVSDGFDSQEPFAKMKLHVFAMMNDWFIEQLRYKVNRGMKGAVARGTSIGKPALGYELVPLLDDANQPVYGADGDPLKTYAIDQSTRPYVELAFKLYGEDHWSSSKIAKHFNTHQINGKKSWCGSTILQMLRRDLYVGIRIYNKTSMRNDPDTGKIITIKNDRKKWQVKRESHLQIIPWKTWKKVQRRLAEASEACPTKGRKLGVNQKLYAKTLFDGTLVCGCCGKPLCLRRSAGDYKQVACPNGWDSRYGCTYKGSKSTSIVERALLGYLRDNLLNADHIQALVDRANHFLAEEAKKPRTDTTGLERTLADLTAKRDRLTDAITTGGAGEVAAVVTKLKEIESQIKDTKAKLAETERVNAVPPKPLAVADVMRMLGDIDEILKQEPAAAAPVLREITGPIKIHQKQLPSHKRPVWVAHFGPNLVPLLRRTAREKNYPDTSTWEYLYQRSWTMAIAAEVVLDTGLKYIKYAREAVRLVDKEGMNYTQAAKVLGVTSAIAQQAYMFGTVGVNTVKMNQYRKKLKDAFLWTQGAEVARRRDELGQSYHEIAEAMGVCRETARLTYLHHHWKKSE